MEVFSFQIYYVPFRFQWMNHFQRKLVKRHIFYIFGPFLVSITFLQCLVLMNLHHLVGPAHTTVFGKILAGKYCGFDPTPTYLTWDCEEQGVLKWGQRNDQGRGVWYKPIFFLFVLLAGFPNLLKNSPRGWENQRPSEYSSSSSRDLNWDKSQDTRLRYRDNTPCSNISWSLTRSM